MAGATYAAGEAASGNDGRNDFDFFMGSWTCRHRRLRTLLAGADDWYEFPGMSVARTILGGLGNMDENDFPTQGFSGMSLRLFDPERRLWAIYWANSRTGLLFPPVFGRFENGEGRFHGEDMHEGTPVKVAYLWSAVTPDSCRWDRASPAMASSGRPTGSWNSRAHDDSQRDGIFLLPLWGMDAKA